ncbi:amidohydrolase [Roseomonas sp. 18066]|uniref:amidohydrolase n=1 Tax=Roseomonas sp. 18066 TaxID=2681412 RepID=UPI00135B7FC7|nr:amidohydrolase family protein [Roseomonas sp. 18066]
MSASPPPPFQETRGATSPAVAAGAVEAAELILLRGRIHTMDPAQPAAEAVAIAGGRFLAVGPEAAALRHQGPRTRLLALEGAAVVPGLTDGHAHMDREGLRGLLPSLAGCRSIAEIQARISDLARQARPGDWIVTMPIGDPPFYLGLPGKLAEGRWPTRQELDAAAPDNPVYIKPIWGYWRHTLPLVSIANSRALALAGIGRGTAPPSPDVEIQRDAAGEPTGIFLENTFMPLVELTLLRAVPGFTTAQRAASLPAAMAAYHAQGTTAVFEGHGVASELLDAYRRVHAAGQMTMRTHLVASPSWRQLGDVDPAALIAGWGHGLAGQGLGDDRLRLAGLAAELGQTRENLLRAAADSTGWAGFHYDAGMERDRAKALLVACARAGIRVTGIWPNILELFAEVDRIAPIRDLRWVFGHITALTRDQVGQIRDLGLGVTTHTNRYIRKEGHLLADRLGLDTEEKIVPLRWLGEAGVPVCLATDNVPISLFPPIAQAVTRWSPAAQRAIGPGQALSRAEALGCVTRNGAWLTFEEDRRGSITPGKFADLAVLDADPFTVADAALERIAARATLVGGDFVHGAPAPAA